MFVPGRKGLKYSVNLLLTYIAYCDAGPGCLQIQYVSSYHGHHIYLRPASSEIASSHSFV